MQEASSRFASKRKWILSSKIVVELKESCLKQKMNFTQTLLIYLFPMNQVCFQEVYIQIYIK